VYALKGLFRDLCFLKNTPQAQACGVFCYLDFLILIVYNCKKTNSIVTYIKINKIKTETMKKFMIALMLGIIVMLFGCSVEKTVQITQQPEASESKQIPPTRWMQNTYTAISPIDPVTFFNEHKITITAKISKEVLMFKDGTSYYVDSSIVVEYTIEKLTPGVLFSVKRQNGLPTVMEISFDESNPDFNLNFFVYSDKSFVLDANCKITYEGKKYKALATFSSADRSNLNHLLSNFEWVNQTTKIENSAGGRNAIGIKIIKKE
jgi:hypothetical protein